MVGDRVQDEEAETILKIRIPQWEIEDYPAWHLERHGFFTVKSAYRLAWQCSESGGREQGTSTASNGERKIWTSLWSTNVQPKVRIFAWMVAHDSLPTGKNK